MDTHEFEDLCFKAAERTVIIDRKTQQRKAYVEKCRIDRARNVADDNISQLHTLIRRCLRFPEAKVYSMEDDKAEGGKTILGFVITIPISLLSGYERYAVSEIIMARELNTAISSKLFLVDSVRLYLMRRRLSKLPTDIIDIYKHEYTNSVFSGYVLKLIYANAYTEHEHADSSLIIQFFRRALDEQ